MTSENLFLLILALLLLTSVVSLSALGVQNLGIYLSLFSICYYMCAFLLKPKRRTVDFVGWGLLYYTGLFLFAAFQVSS